jgi:hypothetical protein
VTSLTRSYLAVLLLLAFGLVVVLADATMTSRSGLESRMATFTTLPGNALAVPYFEARWRVLGDDSGALFPGMRPLSTMDFVYAP